MKPKPRYSEGTFNSRGSLAVGNQAIYRGPYAAEAYTEAGYLRPEDFNTRKSVAIERDQRQRLKAYDDAKRELAAKRASDPDGRLGA